MNYLEFVNDQYLQILIDHQLEGFSLNKIPYVRKLKLREFINFKILPGEVQFYKHSVKSDFKYFFNSFVESH